jgi:hypothetical protein
VSTIVNRKIYPTATTSDGRYGVLRMCGNLLDSRRAARCLRQTRRTTRLPGAAESDADPRHLGEHDYWENDAGAEYPLKETSKQIFPDFFGMARDSPRRARDGVYHAEVTGPPGRQVQIILLDTRYSGRRGHDRRDVGVLSPGTQRLFTLLWCTTGSVFISGDRHFAELSMMDSEAGYPTYDLMSSPLKQKALRHRLDDDGGVAMPLVQRELVKPDDLQPVEVDRPRLPLKAGSVEVRHRLPVEAEEPRHMQDRGDLAQPRDRLGEAVGDAPGLHAPLLDPLVAGLVPFLAPEPGNMVDRGHGRPPALDAWTTPSQQGHP